MRDVTDRAADRLRDERERGERREELGCLETESGRKVICPVRAVGIDREAAKLELTTDEWVQADTVVDIVEVA